MRCGIVSKLVSMDRTRQKPGNGVANLGLGCSEASRGGSHWRRGAGSARGARLAGQKSRDKLKCGGDWTCGTAARKFAGWSINWPTTILRRTCVCEHQRLGMADIPCDRPGNRGCSDRSGWPLGSFVAAVIATRVGDYDVALLRQQQRRLAVRRTARLRRSSIVANLNRESVSRGRPSSTNLLRRLWSIPAGEAEVLSGWRNIG